MQRMIMVKCSLFKGLWTFGECQACFLKNKPTASRVLCKRDNAEEVEVENKKPGA
jgi:hypothetical protein